MKASLILFLSYVLFTACGIKDESHKSNTTHIVKMSGDLGILIFETPDYIDTSFFRGETSSQSCSEYVNYVFDAKSDYMKNLKTPKPNLIHSIRIEHVPIRDCSNNHPDSLLNVYLIAIDSARIHTNYFSGKLPHKDGDIRLVVNGSDGNGNALMLLNRKGINLIVSFLISDIKIEELKSILKNIANSIRIN